MNIHWDFYINLPVITPFVSTFHWYPIHQVLLAAAGKQRKDIIAISICRNWALLSHAGKKKKKKKNNPQKSGNIQDIAE